VGAMSIGALVKRTDLIQDRAALRCVVVPTHVTGNAVVHGMAGGDLGAAFLQFALGAIGGGDEDIGTVSAAGRIAARSESKSCGGRENADDAENFYSFGFVLQHKVHGIIGVPP